MVKFLKLGKVVIVTQGRYASRKAMIVKNFNDGTRERLYGHYLVARITKHPKKVIHKDSAKKMAQKSQVRSLKLRASLSSSTTTTSCRYTLNVDLKDVVTVEAL
ncbi:hypothetical protein Ancab_015155 [Ancistrocladus abbreviatus]